MRIYIPFCGVGFGHVMRSVPLGLGLKDAGHEVYFATHEPVFSKIKKINFIKDDPLFKIEEEIILAQESGKLNRCKTAYKGISNLINFPKMIKAHKKIIDRVKPDLILSDTIFSSILYAKNKNIDSFFMANQTNNYVFFPGKSYFILRKSIEKVMKDILKYSKRILIPDFPPPYTFCRKSIDYFGMKKKFFFPGPIINKRPEKVKEKKFKTKTFLVIIGGTKAWKRNYQIFEKISEKTGFEFYIMNSKINKFQGKVKHFKFVDDLYPYIKGCFSIISHGGHTTLMECATYGKPVIALSTKDMIERENNLYGLEKNNMGIKIENMGELEYAVDDIVNNKKYVKNAKKYMTLSKKNNGIKNVIKLLEN